MADGESRATVNGLAAALVMAQTAAKAVGKDAENKFHKYKYASSEAVIEEARAALSGAGVAVLSAGWDIVPGPDEYDDKGQPVKGWDRVRVRYLVLHGASGERLEMSTESYVVPEKGRPDDKAEAGALTTNLAYFLRALLLLPREDENAADMNKRDDTNREPRRTSRQGPRPAPVARPPDAEPAPLSHAAREKLERIKKAPTLEALREVGPLIKAAVDKGEVTAQERETLMAAYTVRQAEVR